MSREISAEFFGTERVWKIMLKIAPPVMFTQLIQALYNIIDSFFVGKFSEYGLTALSAIYPVQFIITALAVGMGTGINTYMASLYAEGRSREASDTAGTGTVLAAGTWVLFAVLAAIIMKPYVQVSSASEQAAAYAMQYGMIVCIGSFGIFMESMWTKVHQAGGNMKLPMMAQIAGTAVNVVLDPILIFGWHGFPQMGVRGAALATIIGQITAAVITFRGGFYRPPAADRILKLAKRALILGMPTILMLALMSFYIIVLNIILAGFSDAAVTVLGLYYKMQAFFFIPLSAMTTCIVPVLSFNNARRDYKRMRQVMFWAVVLSAAFMAVGIFCFEGVPRQVISIFSGSPEVYEIGIPAFRIIGTSFISAVFSLLMPVFFQAIGRGLPSIMLSLTRQIFCLMPIFWLFSLIGVQYVWLAFPISETIAGGIGLILYFRQIRRYEEELSEENE